MGHLRPSHEDIELTDKIVSVGDLLGIIEHYVESDDGITVSPKDMVRCCPFFNAIYQFSS
ncbi:MAG: hypothetical protein IPO07_32120 [Haliscomenobacter sp.]|nr:hypothetical protein [Haliscomenobacter sp.]